MSTVRVDRWGVPVRADRDEGTALLDQAVEELVLLAGDPVGDCDAAVKADPELLLARVLQAYLSLYTLSPAGRAGARAVLDELEDEDHRVPGRELLHLRAARSWAAGEWAETTRSLERALLLSPRDLLALKVVQDLYFLLGNRLDLRDAVARVLPAWPPGEAGWGYVQGMYAFGLEENAEYRRAEERARAALADSAHDVWATHALAHVYEMEGPPAEGVGFLTATAGAWASSSFAGHCWWHQALFHIDLDEVRRALDLATGPLRPASPATWLDLVDAASLLWRLWLLGEEVSGPAAVVASEMEPLLGDPLYVFNDWHAVMAFGLAGRHDVVAELGRANRTATVGTNRVAAAAAGLDLLDGFAALAEGLPGKTVERLRDVRSVASIVGGSHAQRDVIDLTLLAAAARSGNGSLVRALVAERVARKPASAGAARRIVEANQVRTD